MDPGLAMSGTLKVLSGTRHETPCVGQRVSSRTLAWESRS